ncbi:MAG TPA: sodium/panthothenate symporter [Clostridia bacterium]|nr:sodium/panthothenate symporter [Clostridia bacterium]
MVNWAILAPVIIYLVLVYIIGYYSYAFVSKAKAGKGEGFLSEFFLSGRDLGGFVLAMTLVATYVSAGSFVGGPGTAYVMGLGWVFLAMSQMPTGYLTLAMLGKKFAIIASKIKAITIVDFLRQRYESNAVAVIGSIAIVVFLIASMVAQWVGAARVLQAVGFSYHVGLAVFAITVLIYVTVGGFRAVALTDALQGTVMLIATVAIIVMTIAVGGGVSNIVKEMYNTDPALITPYGPKNFIAVPWICSFWVLVGIGIAGLPQIALRAMAYKTSQAMHRAILIGTPVAGFLMLGMHLAGAFGRVIVPGIQSGDLVIPTLTAKVFPPFFAGIFLAGPLAAIMSTVDSMLILVASAIVKDLYLSARPNTSDRSIASLSTIVTAVIGILVFLLAIKPPSLLVWLNLFSIGGLESTFFWPIVLGLYWKRANGTGALASMIAGMGTYILFDRVWSRPFGTHTVILPMLIALVVIVVVSILTKKPSEEVERRFWGV